LSSIGSVVAAQRAAAMVAFVNYLAPRWPTRSVATHQDRRHHQSRHESPERLRQLSSGAADHLSGETFPRRPRSSMPGASPPYAGGCHELGIHSHSQDLQGAQDPSGLASSAANHPGTMRSFDLPHAMWPDPGDRHRSPTTNSPLSDECQPLLLRDAPSRGWSVGRVDKLQQPCICTVAGGRCALQ